MKIAIYARVSTGRQAEEGVSLEAQIKLISDWAKNHGHIVVDQYVDRGLTATDDRRPEFQRAIQDAVSPEHPFDAIVVYAFSRFFRDAIELGMYERKLNKHNVELISITQPTGDGDAGQMIRQIIAAFDEYSSRENGKNVRRSMQENAKQGFFNGSKPPFGYQAIQTEIKGRSGYKRKLEIYPGEAEIVRTIFQLATEGTSGEPMGLMKITEHLNAQGIRYRGKKWRKQAIYSILSSTTYVGEYIFNRHDSRNKKIRDPSEWVVVSVPPIISRDVFDLAASQRKDRMPGGSTHQSTCAPTLLTGLLRCARCGKNFVLMTGKHGSYRYYKCSTRNYQGKDYCDAPNIPKEELEAVVLKAIGNTILSPSRVQEMLDQMRQKVSDMQKPDREREKALQRQKSLLIEQINNWFELVENGKVEFHSSLQDRLGAMQQKIEAQSRELSLIAKRRQLPLKKYGSSQIYEFIEAAREAILSPDSKLARSYLKAIVSEIRISGNSGEINGQNADMAGAISSWRARAPLMVPRHVSNWRARRDSNS